ncbi:hypothetical protein GGS21DRAFT_294279 [Xylaria nigripes]|nr:hypothetical protein GGS21DRAFT_294279 [Xylaria nigripes]
MAPATKGTNPAPNYTEMMNRVQTQLEAQLRTVRSFLPSKPPGSASTTTPAKSTPSFSALASTSKPILSSSTKPGQQSQRKNEDSMFADDRGQDPNAGLGFGAISKRSSEKEKERGNQILRSRLLGRKRGAEAVSGRGTMRRGAGDESSDEEPGRGGLGRAKKRARREEDHAEKEVADRPISESEALASEPEKADLTQSKDDAPSEDNATKENEEENARDGQAIASVHAGSVPNRPEGISDQKKRRKRKKKHIPKEAETK